MPYLCLITLGNKIFLDDFTGIEVTVTNGSTIIQTTGEGSNVFTKSMVGMMLTFTDGSDGQWYKIVGYNDPREMMLENFYPNDTQTSSATIIGTVSDVDEPYHMALQDYAFYRYFKTQRGASAKANDFKNDFMMAQESYRGSFGDKESSQIILPDNNALMYNPLMVPPINMNGSDLGD